VKVYVREKHASLSSMFNEVYILRKLILHGFLFTWVGLWYLKPLLTIFQSYRGGQFY